jgi:hypothetical protein
VTPGFFAARESVAADGGSRGGAEMEGGGTGSWSSGMRERREIPKIREVRPVCSFWGKDEELLEGLQCSKLTHFGDG